MTKICQFYTIKRNKFNLDDDEYRVQYDEEEEDDERTIEEEEQLGSDEEDNELDNLQAVYTYKF